MNNMNVELVSQMWANYGRNAGFYLEGANVGQPQPGQQQ